MRQNPGENALEPEDREAREIAVIIPTYNRCRELEKCLYALVRQTLPSSSFEIVVVDDGSTDETGNIVEQVKAESASHHVRYLKQPNSGANAARNKAILASTARLLLFINDDTIASSDMVERHCLMHRQRPEEGAAVLGRVTISPEMPAVVFNRLHLDSSYNQWKGRNELDWRAFYTCNVSVKRSFLLEHGLFEEGIRDHEDLELAERLSHHGLRVIYDEKALGYHYHSLAEADFINLAVKEGKALCNWYRKSPELGKKLAEFGFYPFAGPVRKLKYLLGDCLVNAVTMPFLLRTARLLSRRSQTLSAAIYRRIYASTKRATIRRELGNAPPWD